jgi:hypothetical protein
MGNYRKTQFLNRWFTCLNKPEQEYIGNLAHTLLLIQNSGEIKVKEQETIAQISLKMEIDDVINSVSISKPQEYSCGNLLHRSRR